MTAFEIFLNGERICVAGIIGNCVLDVVVNQIKKGNFSTELDLEVAGVISDADEQVIWNRRQLRAGDEVRVKIIESESADEPIERRPRRPAGDLEYHKYYVRQIARQLGWTLKEDENAPSDHGKTELSE